MINRPNASKPTEYNMRRAIEWNGDTHFSYTSHIAKTSSPVVPWPRIEKEQLISNAPKNCTVTFDATISTKLIYTVPSSRYLQANARTDSKYDDVDQCPPIRHQIHLQGMQVSRAEYRWLVSLGRLEPCLTYIWVCSPCGYGHDMVHQSMLYPPFFLLFKVRVRIWIASGFVYIGVSVSDKISIFSFGEGQRLDMIQSR